MIVPVAAVVVALTVGKVDCAVWEVDVSEPPFVLYMQRLVCGLNTRGGGQGICVVALGVVSGALVDSVAVLYIQRLVCGLNTRCDGQGAAVVAESGPPKVVSPELYMHLLVTGLNTRGGGQGAAVVVDGCGRGTSSLPIDIMQVLVMGL